MSNKDDDYTINPLDTDKKDIPQRAIQKKGILSKYPFSWIISGKSGSGKTQLLLNTLSRENMLKNYFHVVIVFSPTANDLDDTYDVLGNIPKENFVKTFDKSTLDNILANRKKIIKKKGIKWVAENNRVCLLFDDCIAEKSFLNSPEALKMFTLLRHYLCSCIILSQSFNGIPKKIRNNANMLSIFPSLSSEVDIMLEEICPSGTTKKEFRAIINHCTDGRYDFMHINNGAEPGKRIRKNLTEVIDIDEYK
jgi:hypothetical protein